MSLLVLCCAIPYGAFVLAAQPRRYFAINITEMLSCILVIAACIIVAAEEGNAGSSRSAVTVLVLLAILAWLVALYHAVLFPVERWELRVAAMPYSWESLRIEQTFLADVAPLP
jgi:hypothetical protein